MCESNGDHEFENASNIRVHICGIWLVAELNRHLSVAFRILCSTGIADLETNVNSRTEL